MKIMIKSIQLNEFCLISVQRRPLCLFSPRFGSAIRPLFRHWQRIGWGTSISILWLRLEDRLVGRDVRRLRVVGGLRHMRDVNGLIDVNVSGFVPVSVFVSGFVRMRVSMAIELSLGFVDLRTARFRIDLCVVNIISIE